MSDQEMRDLEQRLLNWKAQRIAWELQLAELRGESEAQMHRRLVQEFKEDMADAERDLADATAVCWAAVQKRGTDGVLSAHGVYSISEEVPLVLENNGHSDDSEDLVRVLTLMRDSERRFRADTTFKRGRVAQTVMILGKWYSQGDYYIFLGASREEMLAQVSKL